MEVNENRVKCLQQWVKHIILVNSDKDVGEWRTLLQLVDLCKDSNMCAVINTEDIPKTVYSVLSDFFSIDLHSIFPVTSDGDRASVYTHYCLLLLVLTMGLRLKSELFMSAAFKLPSTMHYHIVEMTQPLIEDCPISMTSFEALGFDLENHPVTPIHQIRSVKPPLSCPAVSRIPLLPFGNKEKNTTEPELHFDDSRSGSELFYRYTGYSLCSSPHTESIHMLKGKSCISKSGYGNDLVSETDSPLYSLKSILDSPQVVPKGQFLSKLDEIRSLSSKLSEVQHLYEENMCELSRLSSELQASEMKRKETEVRLKRRESELNEMRDELAYEIEMRSFHEQRSNLVDHLQESLNDALEKLKVIGQLDKQNQELLKENYILKTKEKELEIIRSRLSSQQELERQLTQMKVVAQLADTEIHELLCHRERLLAKSEAEWLAQTNSLIRNQGPLSESVASQCNNRCCSCEHCPSFPHSSQSSPSKELQLCNPDVSNTNTAESLAHVVITQTDYQVMKKKYIVLRFSSLLVRTLSKHRENVIKTFQHSSEVLIKKLNYLTSLMDCRFEKLSEQILNSEAKLNQVSKAITEIKVRENKMITKFCSYKKQLHNEIDKMQLESQIAYYEWEDRINSLKAENSELNAELASLHSLIGSSHVKIDEESEKLVGANMQVSSLKSKLVEVEEKYNESIVSRERLQNELNDQINANKAFRLAAEEEINHLKDSLTNCASNYKLIINNMSEEHRREKDQIISNMKQAEETKDISLEETSKLKIKMKNIRAELSDAKEKVSQVSALLDTFKSEVTELRCELSKTREHLLEVEESLKNKIDIIRCLQDTNNQLEIKLSLSEMSNKRSLEKISELESLAKSASYIHLDLERHSESLRCQLNEMESGWLSTRAQLAETREQLIKTEELLHDTRLRLLRSNYEKNEALERLTSFESKSGETIRTVRSTLDLSSGISSTTHSNANIGIKLPHSESASGDLSSKNNNTNSISNPATKPYSDVAVQKCDPRSHHLYLKHSSGIVKEWPPYSSVTAPVSPGTLQSKNHEVCSGASIPLHSCRFSRLIISPDGDEARELKSIAYAISNKPYSVVSKTHNEDHLLDKPELNTIAANESLEHEIPLDSKFISLTLPYVPKTPTYMLNTINLSRSCSAYEIATVPLDISTKNASSPSTSKDTFMSSASRNSLPMINDKMKAKHKKWVPKKLHKRSNHGISQDMRVKVGRFVKLHAHSTEVQRDKILEDKNSSIKSTWHKVWSKKK
ncbi:dna double-strand break repair rad50 ATPase [Schistosoma japonicum]|nr:dna double-strand break repair rad50 ATPase [Schistosoma japonicum]